MGQVHSGNRKGQGGLRKGQGGLRRAYLLLALAGALAAGGSCALRLPKVEWVPVSAEQIAQADALGRQGDVLISQGETYAALLRYLEAVQVNPNNELLHNKLAIAYTALNYYDRAMEAVLHSLALNNSYAFGYNTLGTIQLMRQFPSTAVRHFEKAILLDGAVATFHINLANAHIHNGNWDKAMAALRRALQIDPEVFTRKGEGVGIQSAAAQFDAASQHYFMARIFAEQGRDQEALQALRSALEAGFSDFDRIGRDREFDALRATEAFRQLLAEFQRR